MKGLLALPIILGGIHVTAWAAVVPRGTEIPVRTDNPVMVSKWDRGRIYPGHVANDVHARNGSVAIPQGAYAELIVRQTGPNQLVLDLESVTVNGTRYAMDTSGPEFNANRGVYDNGGGLIGNIVGAITGVETRGQAIRVPAGSVIRFQLDAALRVVNWADPGYMDRGNHYHREHDWYR
jgi:hypothetical protein